MSTVVNRYTLTPLYDRDLARYPVEHFWHDPDLSAVVGVDPIYWKVEADQFVEMTQQEKDARDAEIVAADLVRDREIAKREIDNKIILRAFAEVIMDEINILRGQHGLAERNLSQLVTAIKAKIDT